MDSETGSWTAVSRGWPRKNEVKNWLRIVKTRNSRLDNVDKNNVDIFIKCLHQIIVCSRSFLVYRVGNRGKPLVAEPCLFINDRGCRGTKT